MVFLKHSLMAVALVSAAAGSAYACRCKHATFESTRDNATLIFTGEFLSAKLASRKGKQPPLRDRRDQFVFRITETFKGNSKVGAKITIHSTISSCGLKTWGGLKKKTYYLVYARLRDGKLHARQCQRLVRADSKQGQRDIKRLRPNRG